jgi:dsRNA-specific ribonuclease
MLRHHVMETKSEIIRLEREQAWIGDAVLSLLAREWVLQREGRLEAELFGALTSNQFLSTLGPPTTIEAQLGKRYLEGGLPAAAAWLQEALIPSFERRWRLRHARGGSRVGRS